MKILKIILILILIKGATFNTFADSLLDQFDGPLINSSDWNISFTSYGNSAVEQNAGLLTIKNGAFLTAKNPFGNPTISGKFSFTGWEYDRFQVIFRSDGIQNDSQFPLNGVGVQFTPSSNPDFGSSKTVQFFNYNNFTTLASASPTISMNTFYEFKITDNGSNISVFLENMVVPLFSYSTSSTYGDMVQIRNREQAAGSWPPPYFLNLDYVSIQGVPEPSSLSLIIAGGAVLVAGRRK